MTESSSIKQSALFYVLFAGLVSITLMLSKKLRQLPKLNSILSEAAMTILVGMIVSFLVSFFILVEDKIEEGLELLPHLLGGPLHDNNGIADETTYNNSNEEETARTLLSFNTQVFFLGFLPPIMFNSGYQLRRELFFRHFEPIVLFATLGTALSAFGVSFILYGIQQLCGGFGSSSGGDDNDNFNPSILELLAFGSLIAATDTVSTQAILTAKKVDPHIFYVVFGESALNDAVALVLFETFVNFLVRSGDDHGDDVAGVGNNDDGDVSIMNLTLALLEEFEVQAIFSPLLGFAFSLLVALAFKHSNMHEEKMFELVLYLLMMYIPFMLAEYLGLSGIVTIFFSGLSARRYIEPNLSQETRSNAETIFELAAFLAETCIFLELGLSVFYMSGSYNWTFICCALPAVLMGRALSIYPISMIYNYSLKEVAYFAASPATTTDGDDHTLASDATISSAPGGGGCNRRSVSRRSIRYTPVTRQDLEIPNKMMHILWLGGIRGAVAYACVRDFPKVNGDNEEFLATTMVIILITVFIMGGMTEPLLHALKVDMNVDEESYMREWRNKQTGETNAIQKFENKYLYQCVVRQDQHNIQPNHNMKAPLRSVSFNLCEKGNNELADDFECNNNIPLPPQSNNHSRNISDLSDIAQLTTTDQETAQHHEPRLHGHNQIINSDLPGVLPQTEAPVPAQSGRPIETTPLLGTPNEDFCCDEFQGQKLKRGSTPSSLSPTLTPVSGASSFEPVVWTGNA